MKRRNPFPGVTRAPDRHGKIRWRFRKKGLPTCYIHGEFGSKEFQTSYENALRGEFAFRDIDQRIERGTFSWLIAHYLKTPDWQKMRPITKRNLGNQLERFRVEHGSKVITELRREHVEALLARKHETPSAANGLLKLIRRLCRFAIRLNVIIRDPSQGITPYQTNPDGYHTWTDLEIEKFEDHHGFSSKAVLAMRLMLFTGAARQDVAAMGWQNVRAGRIEYRRNKTGGEVDLPIMSQLLEVLKNVPRDQMLFITHTGGRGYKPETFGNWFSDQCRAAGLLECSSHGLRKSGATRLANAGATEFEIMCFLGHKTPDEAKTYTKKANRRVLSDSAMAKLENLSNPVERLDKHRNNVLKKKGK